MKKNIGVCFVFVLFKAENNTGVGFSSKTNYKICIIKKIIMKLSENVEK